MSEGTTPDLQLIRVNTDSGHLPFVATRINCYVILSQVGRIRRRHRAGFRQRDS